MPSELVIRIEGARDLKGRFAAVTKQFLVSQRKEMQNLGKQMVNILKEEAPIRTGRLRKGIRFNTREQAKAIRLSFTSEAPYTKYVIEGRGPVVAKRARALRFEPGPPGSGFIFRKRVGPAKSNPFIQRAVRRFDIGRAASKIAKDVEETWKRWVKGR